MSELSAVSIIVSGRVQGVGFRYFVVECADRLALNGWVTNLADGRVELHAQGPEDALNILASACRQGPSGSRVDSVLVHPASVQEGYRDFGIR